MSVSKSLVPLGVTLFAASFAPTLGAQKLEQRAPRSIQSTVTPDGLGQRLTVGGKAAHYLFDLDSGRSKKVSPTLAASAKGCFDNTIDPDGFADALLYPSGSELFDWGVKNCAGSNFVDRIRVGYASFAKPTTQGGPGANFRLRIYSGSTGFGNFGHIYHEILLQGLPSAGFEPSGLLIPSYSTISLGMESFFLPDGPIGWSYESLDGVTAPLLVDVVPSTGTALAYDVYTPGPASAASYTGTFKLGPGGVSNDPTENSFYLRILQNDVSAVSLAIAGQGNPDLFIAPAPIMGSNWRPSVDVSGIHGATSTIVAVSSTRSTGVLTPSGELIVNRSTMLREVSRGSAEAHGFKIPIDPNMLGFQFYGQGGYYDAGGLHLTNGALLTVGSF